MGIEDDLENRVGPARYSGGRTNERVGGEGR